MLGCWIIANYILGFTEMAGDVLADARSGKNGRHALGGLFRQSVFGRLAERGRHMRWIVGGKTERGFAESDGARPAEMLTPAVDRLPVSPLGRASGSRCCCSCSAFGSVSSWRVELA